MSQPSTAIADREPAPASGREPVSPRALTVDEFVARYRIGRVAFYKLVAAGQLRTVKVLGRRLIPVDEAERLLREGAKI